MRDYLLDLLGHAPPGLEVYKVSGTETETTVNAILADRTVIVSAKFKKPEPNFNGVFGLTNLPKLKTILSFEEYADNAKINLLTKTDPSGNVIPTGINFSNENDSFKNEYRFMSREVVNERVKSFTYHGQGWNVEFEPEQLSILRFKRQFQANSEETQFAVKTSGTDLRVYFGSPANHNGNFVFSSKITGSLSKNWQWPVKQFLSILDMQGTKIIKINDQGAAVIEIDSGLINYQFFLPAFSR